MKKYFLLSLFYFSSLCSFAQQKQNDSLQNVLKTTISDTEKVNLLCKISKGYLNLGKNAECIDFANQALNLAQKNNFLKGEIQAYDAIGLAYDEIGKYTDALKNYEEGLKVANQTKNLKKEFVFYSNIANIYMEQGNYDEGLKRNKSALKVAIDANVEMYEAAGYSNIGGAYYAEGNYEEAEKNFLASLKIAEKLQNKQMIAHNYYAIASIYNVQKNYAAALKNTLQALEIEKQINNPQEISQMEVNIGENYVGLGNYSEALQSYHDALDLNIKLDYKKGMSVCYKNIGLVYGREKKYTEAFYNLKLASDIQQAIGVNTDQADTYSEMALLYSASGNYSEAISTATKALDILKKYPDANAKGVAYSALADVYVKLKNYKQAYAYFKLSSDLQDTLLNQANTKELTQMNAFYQSDKKDKEIELLNKEKTLTVFEIEKQKAERNAFVIGFLLMMVLAFFIFRSYREKQKANEIITAQKTEVEHQKILVDEKNKDITDSIYYARRIQRALLTSEGYLKKYLSDYFILYKPKDIVSGDFYWAINTENNFFIATADCTGHGVPGAFMSMLGINFLNEIVIEKKVLQPDKIMNDLRQNIIHALNPEETQEEAKDGMDMVLCAFDFKNRKLNLAASNNPVWIIRNAESESRFLEEIKPDKFPVGKHDKDIIPFTAHEINLQKGDVVYTFTDGYADQFGGVSGKKFKYKALKDLLLSNSHKSMEEQQKVMTQTIESWKGNLEQVDDILLIGIKV
ncbi:MAG: tetratricopeptide repeat protein [Bacteroidia bacterium]